MEIYIFSLIGWRSESVGLQGLLQIHRLLRDSVPQTGRFVLSTIDVQTVETFTTMQATLDHHTPHAMFHTVDSAV